MFVGVQAQTHISGERLVSALLTKHGVHLPGGAPRRAAVFLTIPPVALLRGIDTQGGDIDAGGRKNGHGTVLRPTNVQWGLHGGCQLGQHIRQAAAQTLGHQQGGPDHGDVEEQSKYDVVDFMGLFQMMTTSLKVNWPGAPSLIASPGLCYIDDSISP